MPAAWLIGRFRSRSVRALALAAGIALLLCSPMVYTFAWDGVLTRWWPADAPAEKLNISELANLPPAANAPASARTSISPVLRCVILWSLWAWPIPACIMGFGWAGRGRKMLEAALLDVSLPRALLTIGWRTMAPWWAFSSLVTVLLLLHEYSVPHACGLTVFATELLSWASQSSIPTDTVLPALPQLLLVVLLLGLAIRQWRCLDDQVSLSAMGSARNGVGRTVAVVAGLIWSVSWLVPMVVLVNRLGDVETMATAWQTYGGDLLMTIAVASAAGLVSVMIGLVIGAWRRVRVATVIIFVLWGTLPGALIGMSLVSAYNRDWLSIVYDHWPVVMLAYIARFGWIGILAGVLIHRDRATRVVEQAGLDGATSGQVLRRITLPLHGPVLLCAALTITALAVGDVAGSALVRGPSFTPIAHLIIEKFHRFEDGMLVSLSLWIVVGTVPAACFAGWLIRGRA
ncbi:MAG: ABC transporter permease subunit [Planctomycetota bacterium]